MFHTNSLIKSLTRDFTITDQNFELYLKDINDNSEYIVDDIIRIFNRKEFNKLRFAIYIKKDKLHIVIEEYEDLIDLIHSKKIVLEHLLKDYNKEQAAIKLILKTFIR